MQCLNVTPLNRLREQGYVISEIIAAAHTKLVTTKEWKLQSQVSAFFGEAEDSTGQTLVHNILWSIEDADAGRIPSPQSQAEWIEAIVQDWTLNFRGTLEALGVIGKSDAVIVAAIISALKKGSMS